MLGLLAELQRQEWLNLDRLGTTHAANVGSKNKHQDDFTLSRLKAKLVKLLEYLSLVGGLLW